MKVEPTQMEQTRLGSCACMAAILIGLSTAFVLLASQASHAGDEGSLIPPADESAVETGNVADIEADFFTNIDVSPAFGPEWHIRQTMSNAALYSHFLGRCRPDQTALIHFAREELERLRAVRDAMGVRPRSHPPNYGIQYQGDYCDANSGWIDYGKEQLRNWMQTGTISCPMGGRYKELDPCQ